MIVGQRVAQALDDCLVSMSVMSVRGSPRWVGSHPSRHHTRGGGEPRKRRRSPPDMPFTALAMDLARPDVCTAHRRANGMIDAEAVHPPTARAALRFTIVRRRPVPHCSVMPPDAVGPTALCSGPYGT